jgi:hypothetical protein
MNRNRLMQFYRRAEQLGITDADADALRRIEMTLHRWAERECGDGSDWAIERDEATGKPFNVYHGPGKSRRYRVADKEAGALRRLAVIMARYPELVAYHQGDCRGCMLYVLRRADVREGEDIDAVYTRGWAVAR